MSWVGIPATQTTDWTQVDFLNQFVDEINKRAAWLGISSRRPIPKFVVGGSAVSLDLPTGGRSDIASIGVMQAKVFSIAPYYTDPADLIALPGQVYYETEWSDGAAYLWPDWSRTGDVLNYRAFAGLNEAGFTRKYPRELAELSDPGEAGQNARWAGLNPTVNPGDGRVYTYDGAAWVLAPPGTQTDTITDYGFIEEGDYIGPWIWNELADAIDALAVFCMGAVTIHTRTLFGSITSDPPPPTLGGARGQAVADYQEVNGRGVGASSVRSNAEGLNDGEPLTPPEFGANQGGDEVEGLYPGIAVGSSSFRGVRGNFTPLLGATADFQRFMTGISWFTRADNDRYDDAGTGIPFERWHTTGSVTRTVDVGLFYSADGPTSPLSLGTSVGLVSWPPIDEDESPTGRGGIVSFVLSGEFVAVTPDFANQDPPEFCDACYTLFPCQEGGTPKVTDTDMTAYQAVVRVDDECYTWLAGGDVNEIVPVMVESDYATCDDCGCFCGECGEYSENSRIEVDNTRLECWSGASQGNAGTKCNNQISEATYEYTGTLNWESCSGGFVVWAGVMTEKLWGFFTAGLDCKTDKSGSPTLTTVYPNWKMRRNCATGKWQDAFDGVTWRDFEVDAWLNVNCDGLEGFTASQHAAGGAGTCDTVSTSNYASRRIVEFGSIKVTNNG
ncbi:MAG: hypothetical protein AAF078_07995 [Planctomycetota bacterium]